jgi:hypothetical protein
MELLVLKELRRYLRIMWPTGKNCWRGQTKLEGLTNIHISVLHKSPHHHLRILASGNCSNPKHLLLHTFICLELSVMWILITENCLAQDRTWNTVLRVGN